MDEGFLPEFAAAPAVEPVLLRDLPSAVVATPQPQSNSMHLTALGVHLINSSVYAAAAVEPSHKTLFASGRNTIPVIKLKNPLAPSKLNHADIWIQAINHQPGEPLVIGPLTLKDPAWASIGDNGDIVEVPLGKSFANDEPMPTQRVASPLKTAGVRVDLKAPPALRTENLNTSDKVRNATPAGFALAGTIKLFGKLEARHYSFYGTSAIDISEMVIVQKDAGVNDVFHGGDGIEIANIKLSRLRLSFYSERSQVGRYGLWLESTVMFDGDLKPLGDDMQHFFGLPPGSGIEVASQLARYADWTSLFQPVSFNLTATLPKMSAKLGDHIEIVALGLGFQLRKVFTFVPPYSHSYSKDYSFFGQLKLQVPGSIAPLLLDFSMMKAANDYSLQATGHDWLSAFGVKGLDFVDITFSALVSRDSKSFALSLEAYLRAEDVELFFHGTFNSAGWALAAAAHHLTWDDLCALYEHLFDELHYFEHDITVKDLTVSIESTDRLVVLTGYVSVNGHESDSARIILSTKGVEITAKVPAVPLGDNTIIEDAILDVYIGKQADTEREGVGTSVRLAVTGNITVKSPSLNVKGALYYEKGESGTELLAFADMPGRSLSSFFPATSGTPFDFTLTNVALMYCSTDNFNNIPSSVLVPVARGLQISASIECPPMLAKVLQASIAGLQLHAKLNNKPELDFAFVSPRTLSIKPNLKSSGVTAGIQLDPLDVFVRAHLAIADNPPLELELELAAKVKEAVGAVTLQSDWAHPLGLDVTLLKPLELAVGIEYASAVYPSSFSFKGGLDIGGRIDAALLVCENPKEGVISLKATQLNFRDVVKFAEQFVAISLPQPPADFLFFNEFEFMLSTGASIGPTYYPVGFHFSADVEIFGKHAAIVCVVDKSEGMILKGSIEPFKIGPLEVSGSTGGNATLDMQWGKSNHLLINGRIKLWALEAALKLQVDNAMNITFSAHVSFSELFVVELEASIGEKPQSLRNLTQGEFHITATFEQKIVDYLMAQANSHILAAKHAVDTGIDSASEKLKEAEQAYKKMLDDAQGALDAKKAAWDKHNAEERAAADIKAKKIRDDGAALAAKVDAAKKAFDDFINGLESNLEQSQQKAQVAIRDAEQRLAEEKKSADSSVDSALKKVHDAENDLASRFGDADRTLSNAESRLQDAERDENNSQNQLNNARDDLNNCHWWQKVGKACVVAGLEIEHGAKWAALKIAEGVVQGAKDVLDGPIHKACQETLQLSKKALDDAKKVADAAIAVAQKALDDVNSVQSGIIKGLEQALEKAKVEADQSKAWNLAKKALQDYKDGEAKLYQLANSAVLALEQSVQFVEYKTASAALAVAKSATKEIDIARDGLEFAKKSADAALACAQFIVNTAGNIFTITSVTLEGVISKGDEELTAKVVGVIVGHNVDFEVKFVPGNEVAFVKSVMASALEKVEKTLVH